MMNLLFVSNGTLTPVYCAVAKHLESRGHKIFWMVTAKNWKQFLLRDFSQKAIFYLRKSVCVEPTQIAKVCIPLNEIAFIDREVRHWKSSESSTYMKNVHHVIKNFLVNNRVDFAFSENTWAHEIVISMLCDMDKEVNCRHFSPHNLRIPDNRFAFFSNFLLYETLDHELPDTTISPRDLEKRAEIKAQDDIIVARRQSWIHWCQKLYSFLTRTNNDSNSPTWAGTSRVNSFKRSISQLLKSFSYRFVKKVFEDDILALSENHELYIYAFHKEPETAINNKGRYYESQFNNILNIWRKLPVGTILLIKEHRVSIGDRGYGYFQKLLSLGSIRVVGESVDSAFLLKHCALCFSISGTMAYEFAIHQKPAFTFAKVFFNSLKFCSHLSIDELTKGDDMKSITKRLIFNEVGLSNEEFTAKLSSASFKGKVDDVMNQPEVMDPSNIRSLCSAFEEVVERVSC